MMSLFLSKWNLKANNKQNRYLFYNLLHNIKNEYLCCWRLFNSTDILLQFFSFNLSFKQAWPLQTLGFPQRSGFERCFHPSLNCGGRNSHLVKSWSLQTNTLSEVFPVWITSAFVLIYLFSELFIFFLNYDLIGKSLSIQDSRGLL